MKKNILTLTIILTSIFCNAQDSKATNGGQTAKNKWLLEANTNFGTPVGSNTSFSFSSENGDSVYNIGAEAGYFVMDNLAIKLGLGFGGITADLDNSSILSYKLGAKYYLVNQFPIQLDLSGASIEDSDENPTYLGLQAGYAWFLNNNVSIEPGLRYNLSLNQDYSKSDTFQLNIGFVLHF